MLHAAWIFEYRQRGRWEIQRLSRSLNELIAKKILFCIYVTDVWPTWSFRKMPVGPMTVTYRSALRADCCSGCWTDLNKHLKPIHETPELSDQFIPDCEMMKPTKNTLTGFSRAFCLINIPNERTKNWLMLSHCKLHSRAFTWIAFEHIAAAKSAAWPPTGNVPDLKDMNVKFCPIRQPGYDSVLIWLGLVEDDRFQRRWLPSGRWKEHRQSNIIHPSSRRLFFNMNYTDLPESALKILIGKWARCCTNTGSKMSMGQTMMWFDDAGLDEQGPGRNPDRDNIIAKPTLWAFWRANQIRSKS